MGSVASYLCLYADVRFHIPMTHTHARPVTISHALSYILWLVVNSSRYPIYADVCNSDNPSHHILQAGLVFVGPTHATIAALGNKTEARALASDDSPQPLRVVR